MFVFVFVYLRRVMEARFDLHLWVWSYQYLPWYLYASFRKGHPTKLGTAHCPPLHHSPQIFFL